MIEQLHIFSVCTFYQLKVLSFIWSFFLDNTLFFLFNRKLLLYVLITFSVALTVWFFSLDAYSSYLLLHNKVPPNQAALKKKKKSTSYCSQIRGSGVLLLTQSLREVESSYLAKATVISRSTATNSASTHYSVVRSPVPTMLTSPQSYVNMAD